MTSNHPGQIRPISSHRHNLKSNGVMPINIQLEPLFEEKKKNNCVKIIFISVSRDTNNIIHKNNATRRSKALLTTLLQEMMHAGLS
jgi:hypothetical protein